MEVIKMGLLRDKFKNYPKKQGSILPNYRYKLLLLPHFHRLDENVWFLPNGHRVKYFN